MIYIDFFYNIGLDGFVYFDYFEYSDWVLQDMFGFNDIELVCLKFIQGKLMYFVWLFFMYLCFFLVRKFLKDIGFIFIFIDDNEYVNFKLMMDEIFGEGGFVINVMWKCKKEIFNDFDNVFIQGEYIFVYVKIGQGVLCLELFFKEYIQKFYKELIEQFLEGKW